MPSLWRLLSGAGLRWPWGGERKPLQIEYLCGHVVELTLITNRLVLYHPCTICEMRTSAPSSAPPAGPGPAQTPSTSSPASQVGTREP